MTIVTPPPVRVAIYTRTSTDEHLGQEFNSLDAQREATLAHIEQRRHLGWTPLPESYDDGGFSGGTMERPALTRLLDDIEAGNLDGLVTYKLDRISRSLLDFAKLMEYFEQRGVAFVSVTQEFDSSTPVGRLTTNVLSSFAQFERELISERIRDKLSASRRKGMYTGGILPYGYTNDRTARKLVIDPAEASVVRRVFADYLACRSVTRILRRLNAEGIPTKRHLTINGHTYPGGRWYSRYVRKLLQNPLYIGKVRHQGVLYPGQHEAIIDQEAWEQVQAFIGSGATPVRALRQTALLKGIIRCGHCGCAMTPSSCRDGEKTYRYYLCSTSHRHANNDCPVYAVSAGAVETAVLECLERLLRFPEPIVAQLATEDATSARRQAG